MTSNRAGYFRTPAFCLWPEPESINDISDHQRDEYSKATLGRICNLTGSPGTGKTYVIAQVIKAMVSQGIVGLDDIVVGAPTGKAAVRMTELLYQAGIAIRARTWYSILWNLDESGKIPCRVMFGDESSMDDLLLMAGVLRARAPGCHVMMVGDPNQLPPVGNGAPFRDMIAANVPTGKLTEVRRNAGQIVEACARIRDGKSWLDLCNQPDGNLHFHDSKAPEQALDDLEGKLGALDLWDTQVLVALNDKGPLSRKVVNERLQQFYNVDGEPVAPDSRFRIGDKVVCLKNSQLPGEKGFSQECESNLNNEIYVANGEIGKVTGVEPRGMVVRLEAPARSVVVWSKKPVDDEDTETVLTGNWDLGYAISVHKSQGSEFLHNFILIDDWPGARQVCDASWILTAKSRGRLHTHYFGNRNTAERFCKIQRLDQRKTFLRERIIDSQIALELASL